MVVRKDEPARVQDRVHQARLTVERALVAVNALDEFDDVLHEAYGFELGNLDVALSCLEEAIRLRRPRIESALERSHRDLRGDIEKPGDVELLPADSALPDGTIPVHRGRALQ